MSDSYLSRRQIDALLAPIKPHRVSRDGKGFSHLEAYEVRAHLNRLIGFARWSQDVLEQHLIFEEADQRTTKSGKPYNAWTVCYRSLVRLTVCAPDGTTLATYTEGATGEATNQPSRADAHDLALKSSESQALKRCAVNLGEQFGLSLYAGGSTATLVGLTLVGRDGQGEAEGDPQDLAPPAHRKPDPEPAREASEAPHDPGAVRATEEAPPPADTRTADDFRTAIFAAATKKEVIALLRDAALAGVADAEVADVNGETATVNTLATQRMKEVV